MVTHPEQSADPVDLMGETIFIVFLPVELGGYF